MKLSIQLTEIEINEKWEPEVGIQYLIEYEWPPNGEGQIHKWWLIGTFHKVWFGYTFDWPWSASSLQLGISGRGAFRDCDDWKNFKRVYLFEPHPEPDFISKEDIE